MIDQVNNAITIPANDGIRVGGDFGPDDPAGFDPIVIEIQQPSGGSYGAAERADWLGPRIKVDRPLMEIPTAQAPVRLNAGYRVEINPTSPGDETLALADALPDDVLVTIRTRRMSDDTDLILFRGFVESRQMQALAKGKFANVQLIHVVDVLRRDPEKFVQGQWWVTKGEEAALLADPVTARPTPRRIPALPCVFNLDGRGNFLGAVARQDADEGESDYEEINMPLFTHHLHASAQSWTWARVFAYLYWRMGCDFDSAEFEGLPLGIVFRRILEIIIDNGYLDEDPDQLTNLPTGSYGKILLSKPHSHSIEGLSLWDALVWTCVRSGLHVAVDDYFDFDGEDLVIRSGLRFGVPGEGRRRPLKMASKEFATNDKPWYPDVREATDVMNAQISELFGPCVNAVRVVGAPNRYEVTADLVPLWPYDASLDPEVDVDPDTQAEVDAALAKIGTTAWRDRYRRSGRLHSDWWSILRLWGLPDYRDLSATHARPDGIYDAASYGVFDFSTLSLGEIVDGDDFTVRPRRILPCVTGHVIESPFPPVLEVSVDSGTTWSFMPGLGVQVSKIYFAILLQSEELDDFVPPHADASQSFARAYIRGTLRLRITCSIEGDEAAGTALVQSTDSKSSRDRGRVVLNTREFLTRIREDQGAFSGGNSRFKAGSKPAAERFDQTDLDRAVELLERIDRVRTFGPVEVPGLIVPDLQDFDAPGLRVGDEVEKLAAEAGQSQYDVDLASRDDGISAAIVANITWLYDPGGDGRSPVLATTYTLEDPNTLVSFGRS